MTFNVSSIDVEMPKIKGQLLYPDSPIKDLGREGKSSGAANGTSSQIVLSAKSLGNMLKPKRPFKAKGKSTGL